MKYFNFENLINKYKSEFKAITLSCGSYNDLGEWVKGEPTELTLEGAIISFRESKIHRSDGTLTAKDKRLFTLRPIDNALLGATVEHDGKTYSIEDSSDNAKFTGVYAYTLKYVSAFKEGGK